MLLENLMEVDLIQEVELVILGGLARCVELSRCISLLLRRKWALRSLVRVDRYLLYSYKYINVVCKLFINTK